MGFNAIDMNLDTAIRHFAKFINDSWEAAIPLLEGRDYTTDETSIADWLQSNWEILVERKVLKLNQYLDVYGEGADFNGSSSRVTDMGSLPNYAIKVKSRLDKKILDFLNNKKILINNNNFVEFVSFKNGFYQKRPKFNYVLLEDDIGIERVVLIEEVEFELEEIK